MCSKVTIPGMRRWSISTCSPRVHSTALQIVDIGVFHAIVNEKLDRSDFSMIKTETKTEFEAFKRDITVQVQELRSDILNALAQKGRFHSTYPL